MSTASISKEELDGGFDSLFEAHSQERLRFRLLHFRQPAKLQIAYDQDRKQAVEFEHGIHSMYLQKKG